MAKGGNNQRSNHSRLMKPYDASNSFVKKVALRVSDYIGGLFRSSTSPHDSSLSDKTSFKPDDGANAAHSHHEAVDSAKTLGMANSFEDSVNDSPAKRMKFGSKRKFVSDQTISPITSTNSLFQANSVNHDFNIQNSEDFITSAAGPSGLQNQKYTNAISTEASPNTSIKANGATDNHSDSSESTSGCSSLVPQSDRLSQSAFVNNSRKKTLEDKLQYARQLKQSRASSYFNRSIPILNDSTASRRKPSFDVSAYGAPIFDKSSVREKMVNSPFYTGQTSYGGASAYRRSRTTFSSQQGRRSIFERKDGLQIQVKPSHQGTAEDLSNMSHTAKRILEALEQFSTPISDAKRIPVNSANPPLGAKRKRIEESLDSRLSTSFSKTNSNQTKTPLISGLSVPTIPDLLKLKRLGKIQDSTAAARQVAVQKPEYSLPTEVQQEKHTGKIVVKSKDRQKEVVLEKPPEVNLPQITLPITTLPKFDFTLPPVVAPTRESQNVSELKKSSNTNKISDMKLSNSNAKFKFSPPIILSMPVNVKKSIQKNNFTFNVPLKAVVKKSPSENSVSSSLSNFMSNEAVAKLKRKSLSDKPNSSAENEPIMVTSGSVMDLLRKTLENNKKPDNEFLTEKLKPVNDTWECTNCLIRNLNDCKSCSGCKSSKISVPLNTNLRTSLGVSSAASVSTTEKKSIVVTSDFGNKFKPPIDSWSCKECFVVNTSTATKCIACESPKFQSKPANETKAMPQSSAPVGNGFGDVFKKKEGQWECTVCLIRNKESDAKCVACDNPKPGTKDSKPESLKFSFGMPAGTGKFNFGIDKADVGKEEVKSSPVTIPFTSAQSVVSNTGFSIKPPNSIETSHGVFTFGIPQVNAQQKTEKVPEEKPEPPKPAEPKKAEATVFTDSSIKVDSEPKTSIMAVQDKTPDVKFTENNEKNNSEISMEVKTDETSNVNLEPTTKNFAAKPFSFDIGNKSSSAPTFNFGFQDKTIKQSGETENTVNSTKSIFDTSVKIPENAQTPNSGFSFGQSNPISMPITMNNVGGNSDVNKSSPFTKLNFSEKSDQNVSISSASIVDVTKNVEKVADFATTSITSFTTTNSVFGNSSIFSDSNVKLTFGVGNNNSTPDFGGVMKQASNCGITNLNVSAPSTGFPSTAPIFSSNSNIFNGPSVSAITNSFGSATSTATPSFASTTSQGFVNSAEPGFRPANESTFASSVPSFGNSNSQMSNFGIFNRPATNFGAATTSGFGANATPTPSFGSPFGQPASAPEKPMAPYIFGETNNNISSTTSPASAPTTAPNVFKFGAKQNTEPSKFPNNFGQSSGTAFTFGNPNPSGNLFGSFNQNKAGDPFGSSNSTFGSPGVTPFGQSSAPAAFGGAAQKFEFGATQQAQSAPQPFQFGASTPQTQASSAPATTFSMCVPQKFNFTGGQATTFRATPSSSSSSSTASTSRRVIKAFRRTQR